MNLDRIRQSLSKAGSDLGSRQLLALVGLLIVVAVAIPLLLSHSGTPASLAALPPAPTVTVPQPVAAPVSTTRERKRTPKYLTGPAHNPFRAAAPAKTTTTTTSTTASATSIKPVGAATTQTTSGSTSNSTSSPGSTGSTGTGTSATQSGSTGTSSTTRTPDTIIVAPVRVVVKKVTEPQPFSDYEANVSVHQVGVASTPILFNRTARFQLLPADSGAFASFLGVRRDKKTAVFVLGEGVEVSGHGRCAPSSAKCVFLTLQPGQSVKLSAPAWAGAKTVTLRYAGNVKVTSSASVVAIDRSGRAIVAAAAKQYAILGTLSFGRYTGLLSISLGPTVPVGS
jgi:hypothetical protein